MAAMNKRAFASRREEPGPKATVLRSLVGARLGDGRALLQTHRPKRYGGAIYIAGYGLECALKFRICMDLNVKVLPHKYWNHDLLWLAAQTSRWPAICADRDLHVRLIDLASQWTVTMRYERRPHDSHEVLQFITRASEFSQEVI